MIILGNQKLIETEFANEQEIEDVVVANAEYFFGPSSIFIPQKLIRTKDGFGTIPDGFALDAAEIVEDLEAALAQFATIYEDLK